jgi:hypothetical protein
MGDRTQRLKGKANEAAGKAKGAVAIGTGMLVYKLLRSGDTE